MSFVWVFLLENGSRYDWIVQLPIAWLCIYVVYVRGSSRYCQYLRYSTTIYIAYVSLYMSINNTSMIDIYILILI